MHTKLKNYKYLHNGFIDNEIDYNIKHHDNSKLESEEFEGYRQKYYAVGDEPIDERQYEDSWSHHKQNNPHHWEYWYDPENETYKDAPCGDAQRFVYVVEMLCDWIAMDANGENALDWYDENKDIIKLRDNERNMVEEMLDLYYREEN